MHVATGLAVFQGARGRYADGGRRLSVRGLFAVCVFFSLAPDLDAFAGFAFGSFGDWHNQLTHSALVVAAVAVVAAALTRPLLPGFRYAGRAGLIGLCMGAHLLLDWMTVGRGVMLFWPLSTVRFQCPAKLFWGVRWDLGLWAPEHLLTVFNEAGWLLVLFALATLIRRPERPARSTDAGPVPNSCSADHR